MNGGKLRGGTLPVEDEAVCSYALCMATREAVLTGAKFQDTALQWADEFIKRNGNKSGHIEEPVILQSTQKSVYAGVDYARLYRLEHGEPKAKKVKAQVSDQAERVRTKPARAGADDGSKPWREGLPPELPEWMNGASVGTVGISRKDGATPVQSDALLVQLFARREG